ncbi:hypothetical protein B0H19DRAFT_1071447 [Mycena capillaripes]|nr:hypothetical protein B0H19DRAFT_1071447 [Mycena capillaripes]
MWRHPVSSANDIPPVQYGADAKIAIEIKAMGNIEAQQGKERIAHLRVHLQNEGMRSVCRSLSCMGGAQRKWSRDTVEERKNFAVKVESSEEDSDSADEDARHPKCYDASPLHVKQKKMAHSWHEYLFSVSNFPSSELSAGFRLLSDVDDLGSLAVIAPLSPILALQPITCSSHRTVYNQSQCFNSAAAVRTMDSSTIVTSLIAGEALHVTLKSSPHAGAAPAALDFRCVLLGTPTFPVLSLPRLHRVLSHANTSGAAKTSRCRHTHCPPQVRERASATFVHTLVSIRNFEAGTAPRAKREHSHQVRDSERKRWMCAGRSGGDNIVSFCIHFKLEGASGGAEADGVAARWVPGRGDALYYRKIVAGRMSLFAKMRLRMRELGKMLRQGYWCWAWRQKKSLPRCKLEIGSTSGVATVGDVAAGGERHSLGAPATGVSGGRKPRRRRGDVRAVQQYTRSCPPAPQHWPASESVAGPQPRNENHWLPMSDRWNPPEISGPPHLKVHDGFYCDLMDSNEGSNRRAKVGVCSTRWGGTWGVIQLGVQNPPIFSIRFGDGGLEWGRDPLQGGPESKPERKMTTLQNRIPIKKDDLWPGVTKGRSEFMVGIGDIMLHRVNLNKAKEMWAGAHPLFVCSCRMKDAASVEEQLKNLSGAQTKGTDFPTVI